MRSLLFSLIFSIFSLCFSPSLVFASNHPGACSSLGSGSDVCQYEVLSNSLAKTKDQSRGIRLDGGIKNAIFTSHLGLTRFIDNVGSSDLFVPQGSPGEFSSFLKGSPSIKWAYAIPPYVHTATAADYTGCASGSFSPDTSTNSTAPVIAVPGSHVTVTPSLPAVLDHIRLENPSSAPKAEAGSTNIGSPVQFKYTRTNDPLDCLSDNQGNKSCATVVFLQAHKVTFPSVAISANDSTDYIWSKTPTVAKNLYVSVNGGAYSSVPHCSAGYSSSAPPIHGACGSASSSVIPAASTMCAKGNASGLSSGPPYSWTCSGIGSGATSVTCGVVSCSKTFKTQTTITISQSTNITSYTLIGGGGGSGDAAGGGGGGGSTALLYNGSLVNAANGGQGGSSPWGAAMGVGTAGGSGASVTGSLSVSVGGTIAMYPGGGGGYGCGASGAGGGSGWYGGGGGAGGWGGYGNGGGGGSASGGGGGGAGSGGCGNGTAGGKFYGGYGGGSFGGNGGNGAIGGSPAGYRCGGGGISNGGSGGGYGSNGGGPAGAGGACAGGNGGSNGSGDGSGAGGYAGGGNGKGGAVILNYKAASCYM